MVGLVKFSTKSTQVQVAYIIAAVGAPSKGIAKVSMWVTDTSFSTEYDPSLSRMCLRQKQKE